MATCRFSLDTLLLSEYGERLLWIYDIMQIDTPNLNPNVENKFQ
jgi:hypothetical protein